MDKYFLTAEWKKAETIYNDGQRDHEWTVKPKESSGIEIMSQTEGQKTVKKKSPTKVLL